MAQPPRTPDRAPKGKGPITTPTPERAKVSHPPDHETPDEQRDEKFDKGPIDAPTPPAGRNSSG